MTKTYIYGLKTAVLSLILILFVGCSGGGDDPYGGTSGGSGTLPPTQIQPGIPDSPPSPSNPSNQKAPEAVFLGITNYQQQQTRWCWAAAAQQALLYKNGSAPQQCEIVATGLGLSPDQCCNMPYSCNYTGSISQIQYVIGVYGHRPSSVARPTNPLKIHQALKSPKVIIMDVLTSPSSRHAVIINGIEWVHTKYGLEAVLHINDPWRRFTEPVLFRDIGRYWRTAIVVS